MNKRNSVGKIVVCTIQQKFLLAMAILICVIATVVTALIPPLVLADIIDILAQKNNPGAVLIIEYFGLIFLVGIFESLREILLTVFGQKVTHSIRSVLMEKFTRMTADSISKQEPGAVVSRFVGDVDTIEQLFTAGIVSMFADVCSIISIFAVIWLKNRGLAIILLILVPLIYIFTRYIQKNMLIAQIANRKAIGRASSFVPETLKNIRTIHTLGKEEYVEEKYDGYINDSYIQMEKTNFYDAVYSPVILIMNAVVVAVVMLLASSGNITVMEFFGMSAGTAVAVINYITQIFSPVESLGMEIQTIQSALAGVKRINEFLGMPEIETQKIPDAANVVSDGVVEFRNVTFGYDDKKILKNFDMKIKEGEQVTLRGRTGAGKSTIFKLIMGLYRPDSGSVIVEGMNACDVTDDNRRKIFGYVEQSFHMVPGTVNDQITLFDKGISHEDVQRAAQIAGLSETIESFKDGYDTECTPELFSKGQWQLVSIARAAAANPRILLLDEITANLDAETEKNVLDALERISENRTVISISHRQLACTGREILIK